jgi:hypothetical protein
MLSKILLLAALAFPAFGTDCITPGQICSLKPVVIKLGQMNWVPSATSKAAYDEMRKDMETSDVDGLKQLIQKGEVLLTEGGNSVRVLDASIWGDYTECRLVTGQYKGVKIFTTRAWVVP